MSDRALIREAQAFLAKRLRRKTPQDQVLDQLLARIDNELSKWSAPDLSGDEWPVPEAQTTASTAAPPKANTAAQSAAAEGEVTSQSVLAETVLAEGLKLWQVVPRLREEREARGLTMRDMYEATGMTSGRLSRLENQIETNPTIGTLERLAAALGVRLMVTLVEVPDEE